MKSNVCNQGSAREFPDKEYRSIQPGKEEGRDKLHAIRQGMGRLVTIPGKGEGTSIFSCQKAELHLKFQRVEGDKGQATTSLFEGDTSRLLKQMTARSLNRGGEKAEGS